MSEGMANNQQNMFQMSMEEQVRMQQMTAPGEGEKKRGIGSRIGYFFLTIVPPVVSMILQLVAVLLVVFVGALIAGATGKIDVTNQINMMIQIQELVFNSAPLGIMLYHIIGILVFGLWFRACYKKPRPTIKGSFEKVNGKAVVITVICGIALCIFSNATILFEYHVSPGLIEEYEQLMESAQMGTSVFTVIAAVLLAPIGEEFLCRGLCFRFAKKSLGNFWLANIFQAFLFGCIHGNLVQGIYAFCIGLVLGWLVERYDSLVPAMLLHFVVNLSSTTWVPVVGQMIWPGETMPSLIASVFMLVIPAAIIVVILVKEKKVERN